MRTFCLAILLSFFAPAVDPQCGHPLYFFAQASVNAFWCGRFPQRTEIPHISGRNDRGFSIRIERNRRRLSAVERLAVMVCPVFRSVALRKQCRVSIVNHCFIKWHQHCTVHWRSVEALPSVMMGAFVQPLLN
jgi:hypothetical protein